MIGSEADVDYDRAAGFPELKEIAAIIAGVGTLRPIIRGDISVTPLHMGLEWFCHIKWQMVQSGQLLSSPIHCPQRS